MVEPAAALSHSLTVPIREEHLPPKNAGVTTMTPRRTTIEMGFATVSSIARETMGSDVRLLRVPVLKRIYFFPFPGIPSSTKYQINHKGVLVLLTG